MILITTCTLDLLSLNLWEGTYAIGLHGVELPVQPGRGKSSETSSARKSSSVLDIDFVEPAEVSKEEGQTGRYTRCEFLLGIIKTVF